MENYYSILGRSELFKSMSDSEVNNLLVMGSSFTKSFSKNEVIYNEGFTTEFIYFILEGEVTIHQNDVDGNTFLKSKLKVGNSFAHVFALTKKESNCIVISATDTKILCFNLVKVINSNDALVSKFKDNLLMFMAYTTYFTSNHLSSLSLKTLRKKIFSYLINFDYRDQKYFEVTFNREQMAQYLGVNRTSLSKELILLKNEGILDYKKNKFVILDIDYFESHI